MFSAIRERRERLREVLETAESVARRIAERHPRSTILLIGSYARGDFNLWSDIDLLVIIDDDLPRDPLKRFELIQDLVGPNMEPHILTLGEYRALVERRDPVILKALAEGRVLVDNLHLGGA